MKKITLDEKDVFVDCLVNKHLYAVIIGGGDLIGIDNKTIYGYLVSVRYEEHISFYVLDFWILATGEKIKILGSYTIGDDVTNANILTPLNRFLEENDKFNGILDVIVLRKTECFMDSPEIYDYLVAKDVIS